MLAFCSAYFSTLCRLSALYCSSLFCPSDNQTFGLYALSQIMQWIVLAEVYIFWFSEKAYLYNHVLIRKLPTSISFDDQPRLNMRRLQCNEISVLVMCALPCWPQLHSSHNSLYRPKSCLHSKIKIYTFLYNIYLCAIIWKRSWALLSSNPTRNTYD